MIKEVKIELTEHCERECVHCSSKAQKIQFQYLDEILVKRIIHEATLLKAQSIVFTGGEATLYPKLTNVIQYAHDKGLRTKLYTMCDPDQERIKQLHDLTFYGLDEIIYSTAYRLTRDSVVTLEKLQYFFPKLLENKNVSLGFHHTITKETLQDIDDITYLFFSLPKDQTTNLSFLRFVPHGRGTRDLKLSREELMNLKAKLTLYQKQYGDRIRLGSPWNFLGIDYTPCSAAKKTMIVGFDGHVYPCDAMKYFDYFGSGGNIYQSSLPEIYNSEYFNQIRKMNHCIGEVCEQCSNLKTCRGGCLGQKMIDFISDGLTFTSYGNNARRTMNSFDTNELKKMNGEMGIVGEIGELVDLLKKYKTHNLTEESKIIIRKNLEIEIGDIVWYLAASLSSFYQFEFADIGNFIVQKTPLQRKTIDVSSINESAKRRDPECLMEIEQNEIPISYLDQVLTDDYCFDSEWKSLVQSACEIIYSNNEKEVLEKSATLLLVLSKLAKMELGSSMEKILSQNIEKLKQRYQTGFDSNIASSRIQLLTDYKNSEPPKVYEKTNIISQK